MPADFGQIAAKRPGDDRPSVHDPPMTAHGNGLGCDGFDCRGGRGKMTVSISAIQSSPAGLSARPDGATSAPA